MPYVPELPQPGEPVRLQRPVVFRHHRDADAAAWTGCSARSRAAARRTFEVTEEANTRFLDRMTELLDDSVFYARRLRDRRGRYYFNQQRGGHAAAADLHPQCHLRSIPIPVERLPVCVIREDQPWPRRILADRASRRWPASASQAPASRTSSSPSCSTDVTAQAFPRETRRHVYIDGGIETAIGARARLAQDAQARRRRAARIRRLSGGQRRP